MSVSATVILLQFIACLYYYLLYNMKHLKQIHWFMDIHLVTFSESLQICSSSHLSRFPSILFGKKWSFYSNWCDVLISVSFWANNFRWEEGKRFAFSAHSTGNRHHQWSKSFMSNFYNSFTVFFEMSASTNLFVLGWKILTENAIWTDCQKPLAQISKRTSPRFQ